MRWHDILRRTVLSTADDPVVRRAFEDALNRKLLEGFSVVRFVVATHAGMEWRAEVELSDKASEETACQAMKRLCFEFQHMMEIEADDLWRRRDEL